MAGESRQSVLDYVRNQPGVTKSELCRGLQMGWGTVDYHVRNLELAGDLRVLRTSHTVCLFAADVPSLEAQALAVLHRPVAQEILKRLKVGKSGVRELARDLEVSRQTIRRHLSAIRSVGAIPPGEPGPESQ